MIKQTLLLITLCALSQAKGAENPSAEAPSSKAPLTGLEGLQHQAFVGLTPADRRPAEAALRFLKKKPYEEPRRDILKVLQEYNLASQDGKVFPGAIKDLNS